MILSSFIRRLAFSFFFFILLFSPYLVFAEIQRMAISKGSYSLPPRGTKQVEAYCLDESREPPNSRTYFTSLLTSHSSARVRIGNARPIPLQQAIDNGSIAIVGTNLTREWVGQLAERQSTSPLDRLSIEFILAEAIGGPDNTSLILVNTTNQSVSIVFGENVAVGREYDTAPVIDPKHLTLGTLKSQDDVWRKINRKHQAMLRATGYYRGGLSGTLDEATKKAIRNFKSANKLSDRKDSLKKRSEIDSETEKVLFHDAEKVAVLKKLSRANPLSTIVTIESYRGQSNRRLYKVFTPSGVLYSGDSSNTLSRKLVPLLSANKRKNDSIVNMEGFSENRLNAFQSTLNVASPSQNFLFNSTGDMIKGYDFYFSTGKIFVVESVSEPAIQTDAAGDTTYSSTFKVKKSDRDGGSFRIFAKVKEKLLAVSKKIQSFSGLEHRSRAPSPAQIVSQAFLEFPEEKFLLQILSIDTGRKKHFGHQSENMIAWFKNEQIDFTENR